MKQTYCDFAFIKNDSVSRQVDATWNAVLSADTCASYMCRYLSFLPQESNSLVLRASASLSHVAENWHLREQLSKPEVACTLGLDRN